MVTSILPRIDLGVRALFKRDKQVLNVGGGSKFIPLPPGFEGYKNVVLDIEPKGGVDMVCDARQLKKLSGKTYDAVLCSHNLEHYYHHEVGAVLSGMLHVLKPGGFLNIRVPDILAALKIASERGLDLEDTLYHCGAGPIKVIDVIYGYGAEIKHSGQPFYAHKTAFTVKSLTDKLARAGFVGATAWNTELELVSIAFKDTVDESVLKRFK